MGVKDVDDLELRDWVMHRVRDAAVRAWEEARGGLFFWDRYARCLSALLNGAEVELVPRLRVHPDVVRAAMEWKGVGPADPRFTFVRIEFASFPLWLVFDAGVKGGAPAPPRRGLPLTWGGPP
jgi:hypothetical protein